MNRPSLNEVTTDSEWERAGMMSHPAIADLAPLYWRAEKLRYLYGSAILSLLLAVGMVW